MGKNKIGKKKIPAQDKILQDFAQQINELKWQVSLLCTTCEDLRRSNDALVVENFELKARTAELEVKNAELEADNDELDEENEELATKNKKLKVKVQELETQSHCDGMALGKFLQQCEMLKVELEKKKIELDQKKKDCQNLSYHLSVVEKFWEFFIPAMQPDVKNEFTGESEFVFDIERYQEENAVVVRENKLFSSYEFISGIQPHQQETNDKTTSELRVFQHLVNADSFVLVW